MDRNQGSELPGYQLNSSYNRDKKISGILITMSVLFLFATMIVHIHFGSSPYLIIGVLSFIVSLIPGLCFYVRAVAYKPQESHRPRVNVISSTDLEGRTNHISDPDEDLPPSYGSLEVVDSPPPYKETIGKGSPPPYDVST